MRVNIELTATPDRKPTPEATGRRLTTEAAALAGAEADLDEKSRGRDRGPEVDRHARCLVLSGVLRGKLCEQLARRPSRRAPPGRLLYFVGESAKSLYYIKTGLVKTSRTTPTGDEMILKIHRPGEIFGELCFCTGERRDQAVALEASEIVEITLVELLAHIQRTPDTALDLIAALCERLGDAHDRLQSIAFESALERLARTLLLLADTLGEDTPEGTHIVHYVRQEELAQMVAARREVVSGLLNRLRERGLISYSRKGEITVHRVPLQAYLESLGRPSEK